MPHVHATSTTDGHLFFWADGAPLEASVASEIPPLPRLAGPVRERPIVAPGLRPSRRAVRGFEASPAALAPLLAAIPSDADVSDSVRCWQQVVLLALELTASQRVAPTVRDGTARWRALLARDEDRRRLDAITEALPPAARSTPTTSSGTIRLPSSELAVRSILDATVDGLMRSSAYPGTGRGWAHDFAQVLRGEDDSFQPRNAREQTLPDRIAAWADAGERAGLRLGIHLGLPRQGVTRFPVTLRLHSPDAPDVGIPVKKAWDAGRELRVGTRRVAHPAMATLRELARAVRLHPPLSAALEGSHPRDLSWDAAGTWRFLSEGRRLLEDAGFVVSLPEEFASAGRQRIRARLRLVPPPGAVDLGQPMPTEWEVLLGERVLDGAEFDALVAQRQPIVRHRGEWVLLDPEEVARLPSALGRRTTTLEPPAALRAILLGEHQGVPVVCDDRIELVVEALRNPPEEPVPDALRATLRPYQRRGFAWLSLLGRLGLGACLADDMGLGKTLQVIVHALARRGRRAPPSLVVCPTSVLGNWQRELARFAPTLRVHRHHGIARDLESAAGADVVLTTYGLLVRDADALAARKWDVVVLDEAQAIKNPESRRANAARRLVARHRVGLTGTPLENRLDELWSLFAFLIPGLLGARGTFRREVAVPVERFHDHDAAARLQRTLAPFLLRRMKTDPEVAPDLPEKIERIEYCGLSPEQARLYEEAVEAAMAEIAEADGISRRGRVLAMLTTLKQVCNHPAHARHERDPRAGRSAKLERCTELVQAVVEGGERLLIFTQYREMGELLRIHFERVLGESVPFLHGGTLAEDREAMVRDFQEADDAPPLLLLSLRAGGTGLNLTRATHVVHYDRWWNPAVEDQATDRVYRIGQRQNVQVHKMVCQGTLEERIDAMLQEKRALAGQVVAAGETWLTELDDVELRSIVGLGEDAVVED